MELNERERVTALERTEVEVEVEVAGMESREMARRVGMDRPGRRKWRRCDGVEEGGGVGMGLDVMLLWCVIELMM